MCVLLLGNVGLFIETLLTSNIGHYRETWALIHRCYSKFKLTYMIWWAASPLSLCCPENVWWNVTPPYHVKLDCKLYYVIILTGGREKWMSTKLVLKSPYIFCNKKKKGLIDQFDVDVINGLMDHHQPKKSNQ